MNLGSARVLITGGGGGIGSAIATELLEAGAAVLLADLNESMLAATARRLSRFSDRLDTIVADISDATGRERLCRRAMEWRVNVLVNNAGVNHFGLFDDMPSARIAQTISINVLAPMLLVQELLPYFKAQPEAHVLNMGSVFGHIGFPGYTAYSASKFAVRGFTEALRRELADSNTRIHYLAPRATRTPINSAAVEKMNAELKVTMDPPERVARAARLILERDGTSAVVGWPEKLFARVNAILPRLVDGAIRKQMPVIERYARGLANAGQPVTDQSLRRKTP